MTNPLAAAVRTVTAELAETWAREDQLEEARAAHVAGGLRRYARQAWPWLEPATQFVPNWHIDVICEHLELAFRRDIHRLLINIQPRVMKSTLVSVLGPTWRWTTDPQERFVTASYALDLARRDAVKSRHLINSPWYRSQWADVFRLVGDQNEKSRYLNDRTGYRVATSVGAGVTGEGGDVLILDDPNEQADAYSEAARQEVKRWWGGTWATRLNDLDTGVKIVIQQRIHEDDLTGHILNEEGTVQEGGEWVHLCLPAEYEPSHPFVWPDDPRKDHGDLLWPAHVSRPALEKLKRTMGSYAAAGQLQQRPSPSEGGIIKRAWWRYYEWPEDERFLPGANVIVHSWDTNWRDKTTSDFVAGQVWAVRGANRFLLRTARGRWGLVEAKQQIRDMYAWAHARYPTLGHTVLVENRANGPDIIAALRGEIPGVVGVNPKGDKVQRAFAVTPQLEAGNVFVPGHALADGSGPDPARTPAVVQELIEEAASFPNGAHDDQVDALTQALIRAGVGAPSSGPAQQPRSSREAGILEPAVRYGRSL